MRHTTYGFTGVLQRGASKIFAPATSITYIVLSILLVFSGLSLFFLSLVDAQEMEIDIAPAAPTEHTDGEDVIDGAFYFRLMCWNCHAGQTRGGRAPDLFKPQWLYGWTDDGIYQTVFNGLPGTEMQKFGGKLSDEAIAMIVDYVRTEQAKAAGVSLEKIGLPTNRLRTWMVMRKPGRLSFTLTDTLAVNAIQFTAEAQPAQAMK